MLTYNLPRLPPSLSSSADPSYIESYAPVQAAYEKNHPLDPLGYQGL
jgi:hypothetical protein